VIAAATAERKRKSQAILKPILSVRDCSATGHDKSRTGMRILREAGPASLTRVKLEERPLSYLAHACVRREMHAMVLTAPGAPLRLEAREDPAPGPGDVRVKVGACGACRTDLHVVDGELPGIAYPVVPGHEVVGRVDTLGAGVVNLKIGERVGVPWLGYTCGERGDVQAAILSIAAESNLGLLVMGGYGHSRLHERILGGVTRSMFESMTVPVLMSH
jgi:nucleotide-binding universal stress UspA family protein